MSSRTALLALTFAPALALSGAAQAGDIGIKVLLQQWSPLTPDKQSVQIALNAPTKVSDTLVDAWRAVSPGVCDSLKTALGKPGAAGGQTLRDIECSLGSEMRVDAVSTQYNHILVTITAASMHVAATTTVPDPFNFDPRVSIDLDGRLQVALEAQPTGTNLIVMKKAVFSLAGAQIDSHNASGDVAKWLAEKLSPFLGGPNFKTLVEDAINSTRLDVTGRMAMGITLLNSMLQTPSGYVRANAWLRPDYMIYAAMPAPVTPPADGLMTGWIDWSTAGYTPAPNACNSLKMRGTVQTSAAPLQNPDDWNQVGAPATRDVGSPSIYNLVNMRCAYSLAQLPAHWPTVIRATIGPGPAHTNGASIYKVGASLRGDGWDGRNVVPTAENRNYLVSRDLDAADLPALNTKLQRPGDPAYRSRLATPEAVTAPTEVVAPSAPRTATPNTVTAVTQPAVVTPAPAQTPAPATPTAVKQSPAVRATATAPVVPSGALQRGAMQSPH